MPTHKYPWKRFWCPRGDTYHVDEEGYLSNPDSTGYLNFNRHLVSLESLSSKHCLILLGEPGIGKSTEIRETVESLNHDKLNVNKTFLRVDLAGYSSEDRLVREVFEEEGFRDFKNGVGEFTLFLDSFDECLIQIKTLADIIIQQVRKTDASRFFLRIGCRTARWPAYLEKAFSEFWSDSDISAHELTVLRQVDVESAASFEGLSADDFVNSIRKSKIQPLASRPVTLMLLFTLHKEDNRDKEDMISLYERGCRTLCTEGNDGRKLKAADSSLSTDVRLAIASRVAAFSTFCRKNSVWLDKESDRPETAFLPSEITSGTEWVNDCEVQISEKQLSEVFDTGLFTGFGRSLVGFTHSTIQEFLAAHYLMRRKMPIDQLSSLMKHPGDTSGRIVPQFLGVATWLMRMFPLLVKEFAVSDVIKTIRQDGILLAEDEKKLLVEGWLSEIKSGKLSADSYAVNSDLHVLRHGELESQLRPWIENSANGLDVRRQAISLAVACSLEGLYKIIGKVALDKGEPTRLRVIALRCLREVDDPHVRASLIPLIKTDNIEDPDDEIRGCALSVCWPDLLSLELLLEIITPPRRSNFIGVYRMFLDHAFIEKARSEHLPGLLDWATKEQRDLLSNYDWERIIENLTERAWEHLESRVVFEAFVSLILSEAKRHNHFLSEYFRRKGDQFLVDQAERRYNVAESIISRLEDLDRGITILLPYATNLLSSADILWLTRVVIEHKDATLKEAAAKLIRILYWPGDTKHYDAVVNAYDLSIELRKELGPLSVILDSPEAEAMKNGYREHKRLTERPIRKRARIHPPIDQRILSDLGSIEAGDFAEWVTLVSDLSRKSDESHVYSNIHLDITKFECWIDSLEEVRNRIVQCAEFFLINADPKPSQWIGSNEMPSIALAGCMALNLLLRIRPRTLELFDITVWKKWSSTIVALGWWIRQEDESSLRNLLAVVMNCGKIELLDALNLVIDKEDQSREQVSSLDLIEHCWCLEVEQLLMQKLGETHLKCSTIKELLTILLSHSSQIARSHAISLLQGADSAIEGDFVIAVSSAQALINQTDDSAWGTVLPLILQNEVFGKEVILGIASRHNERLSKILNALDESQLAVLYRWLISKFRPEEDPDFEGSHSVSPREEVARFREIVLDELKRRGTENSAGLIAGISEEFPQYPGLRYVARAAKDKTLEETAPRLTPNEFWQLVQDPEKCILNNGVQLLDLILRGLKKLQAELQGEIPLSRFLWNEFGEKGSKKVAPKEEDDLSDFVVSNLRRHVGGMAIAVNREVVIRKGVPGVSGHRTDIYFDAFVDGSGNDELTKISAIVEVKRCHNSEVKRAMETQLVNRYMQQNKCAYGLFLVGWFHCESWQNQSGPIRSLSIQEARDSFVKQAKELSSEGRVVRAFVLDVTLS